MEREEETVISYALAKVCPILKTTLLVVNRMYRTRSSTLTKCVVIARVVSLKPLVLTDCTDNSTLLARADQLTGIPVGAYVRCVISLDSIKSQLEVLNIRVADPFALLLHLSEVLRIESTAEREAPNRSSNPVSQELKENVEVGETLTPLEKFSRWISNKESRFTMEQLKQQFSDPQEYDHLLTTIERQYRLVCMGEYYEAFLIKEITRRSNEG